MNNSKIILGSQSPRRYEILTDAGFEVDIIKPRVDERYPMEMDVYKVPEYLSKVKIMDIYQYLGDDDDFIITADTIVILNKKIIGKPANLKQAKKTLQDLSGKVHDVVTGVSIRKNKKQISFSDTTKVFFKNLTDQEIDYFVEKYNPLDKAGAYGIQEWIGYIGVEKIEGCYYNVMGLPMPKVYEQINNWE